MRRGSGGRDTPERTAAVVLRYVGRICRDSGAVATVLVACEYEGVRYAHEETSRHPRWRRNVRASGRELLSVLLADTHQRSGIPVRRGLIPVRIGCHGLVLSGDRP